MTEQKIPEQWAKEPGYSKKADPKDRLEYLKLEKNYLEKKLKKFKADVYPDKEKQDWYTKVFTHNLDKVVKEISELNDK